jgi:hypothetical protein
VNQSKTAVLRGFSAIRHAGCVPGRTCDFSTHPCEIILSSWDGPIGAHYN